jgi:hypothetical protein
LVHCVSEAFHRLRTMFTLDQVVPWGRSFNEYRNMFALTDGDLTRVMLGCGDGPASFNAEATRRGASVVSCDPLYQFAKNEIEDRITATTEQVLEQTARNAHEFVWQGEIQSPDDLRRVRLDAMREFLEDYDSGKREGRYVVGALPALPFGDATFELGLCSHFLFLYSAHLSQEFHSASVRELCRVAREVRIFPLLALGGGSSEFVDVCVADTTAAGLHVSIETVAYEFQRGGNQMMRITRGA